MKNLTAASKLKKHTLIGGLSLLAGLINGFVGTGGGIVLIFLFYLMKNGEEGDVRENFAMTIISVIPMSFAALFVYLRGANVDIPLVGRLFVPTVLGGVVGAYLMDKIDKKWLTIIFSALIIYSGVRLIGGVI